ncbi:hypothetical protein [Flavobacterium sp. WV_118_3]|uniref:hypothetical protein n=1 Tax=Flavobacterium sp. WV_118_3 TaxID=3151764 RepID=UPI00321A48F7
MEQSKFFGKGGWLARQFRRASSFIRDTPILRDFFGQVAMGLDFAADGAEAMGFTGLKTSVANIDLTPLEEQQLDQWINNFTAQLKPKLEQFARYNDQYTNQQKIDSINDMYRQLGAIQAHFSAPVAGYSTNQIAARKQFVDELTKQIRLKVEFLTTDLPFAISVSNKNVFMSSIDTGGITSGSPVVSVVVPQITTSVKTTTSSPELIVPNIPNTGIYFNPESPVKDVATSEPIKVDPSNPVATNPTNVATGGKKSNVLLKGLGLVAAGYVLYKVIVTDEKPKNKKSNKK